MSTLEITAVLFNILGGADRAAHNDACHQH